MWEKGQIGQDCPAIVEVEEVVAEVAEVVVTTMGSDQSLYSGSKNCPNVCTCWKDWHGVKP